MTLDIDQKRCISWIAVSSKPQTEKESPDEQRQSNLAIINDVLNGRLVAELEVPGESREIISFEEACERIEAYAQLRELIRSRGADILVCRDISRLGRTAALAAQVVAHCLKAGIAIYSIAAPPSSLDAREQAQNQGATIMLAVEGALSEIEITKFKNRHTFGMLGRAKRGLMAKGERFGWRAVRDERGKVASMEIVEEQAECVRYIFDAYVNGGRSITSIFNEMNRRGMVTSQGKSWLHISVSQILDNAWGYAGYVEYNKRSKTGRPYYRGQGIWPAIIDDKMAQAAIDERKRRAAGRRAVESPYKFTGVCICAKCGGRLMALGWRKPSGRRYCCRSRCRGSYITEQRLMSDMLAFLESIKVYADLAAAMSDNAPDARAEYAHQIERVERQLAAIAEQRKRHARNNAMGILDDTEFRELMQEAANQRLALEAHRQELQTRLAHTETESEYQQRVEDIIDAGSERLQSDDIPAINAWLRQNFRIRVADNKTAEIAIV